MPRHLLSWPTRAGVAGPAPQIQRDRQRDSEDTLAASRQQLQCKYKQSQYMQKFEKQI